MDVLEGFKPVSIGAVGGRRMPTSCSSRALLEAFVESGEECISKEMDSDELRRVAYNLRHYRHSHRDEFAHVGIAARNGSLILYRSDADGSLPPYPD